MNPRARVVLIAFCSVLAALWTYLCGSRGFFALDQSIVFDGGYRLYRGQKPFVDFYSPQGLPLFYFQALWFSLFGVSYRVYLTLAAFGSLIAVLLHYAVLKSLAPKENLWCWMAFGLAAFWCFAPFGTPYPELWAFLLVLVSIFLAIQMPKFGAITQLMCGLSIGALLTLAFLTKQSVALVYAPLIFLLPGGIRQSARQSLAAAAQIMLGCVVSSSLVAIYFYESTPFDEFIRYTFLLPWETAIRRVPLLQHIGLTNVIAMYALSMLALVWGVRTLTTFTKVEPSRWLALLIGSYVLMSSAVLHRVMLNSALLADCALGLLIPTLAYGMGVNSIRAKSGLLILAILLSLYAATLGYTRKIHETLYGANFYSNLPIPALEALRWAEPTRLLPEGASKLETAFLHQADLLCLVNELTVRKGNFFIFPDFTLLYGVMGTEPPQPLLWFHQGLTYPTRHDATLDAQIVHSLEAANVRTIVIEKESFFGTEERLSHFPLLAAHLSERYEESQKCGNFQIFKRLKS